MQLHIEVHDRLFARHGQRITDVCFFFVGTHFSVMFSLPATGPSLEGGDESPADVCKEVFDESRNVTAS
jgi:hypothetical protein